jgi:hypothetical protein
MGHNTKDTLKERIDLVLEGANDQVELIKTEADGEVRRIKCQYNRQVLEELESNLQDKEDSYNAGFITVHECLKLKRGFIQKAIDELYAEDEVEHPTVTEAKQLELVKIEV